MYTKPIVLIVDDLSLVRLQFRTLLSPDYTVLEASAKQEALSLLATHDIRVVILDLIIPGITEFELLLAIRKQYPDVAIIMATVSDDPSIVLKSLKHGAKDYIFKEDLNLDPHILKKTVHDVLAEKQQKLLVDVHLQEKETDVFIPTGAAYQDKYEVALRAVKGDLAVVILGETGVGKGTLVSYIHQMLMPKTPLVTVNCGAIVHSLAEAELFGAEKGAFTDASETRKGKLELANGGILFLDEIGNLSREIQEKLLCVLETKRVVRVGGSKELQLDFRLIVATNKDLEKEVQEGRFRSDLFYRIHQFPVVLPPLRDQPQLILEFAQHYMRMFNQKYNTDFGLSPDMETVLLRHSWIGNLRELKNEVRMMVWLHSQGEMYHPRWENRSTLFNVSDDVGLPTQLEEIEKVKIQEALQQCGYNLSAASRVLGVHRSTLQGKLRKYKLYPKV